MLWYPENPEPPEKYSKYCNRTMEKFRNRTKSMVNGVMQCSLRPQDTIKLLNEMAEIIKKQLP